MAFILNSHRIHRNPTTFPTMVTKLQPAEFPNASESLEITVEQSSVVQAIT
jgi:hypothetical protein